MTRTRRKVKPENLVLYRFFDADGALLYVGKSTHAWDRFAEHRRGSAFYPDAAAVTLQRGFVSEAELAAAEVSAIRSENPRFNINLKVKPPRVRKSTRPPLNPCGALHYCGDRQHGDSGVCADRDQVDLEMTDRLDGGESADEIAADLGCRPSYVRCTHARIRHDQAIGVHGCWECPAAEFGVSRATVYNVKNRTEAG